MLRTRMVLGLSVFVVLLLGLGILAVTLLFRMAERVDAAVTGDYRSILVAQTLHLELGTLEREIWASTTGTNTSASTIRLMIDAFEQNLTILTNSATAPDERDLCRKLVADFQTFKTALIAFRTEQGPKARSDIHQMRIMPAVLAMGISLEQIREVNDKAIVATPGMIQSISRNIARLLVVTIALVLLVSGYVFYRIAQSILRPIEALTRATRDLGAGQWQHPVPVESKDELGGLTRSFNTMAAQLQEYRRSTTDEIVRLHRTMESTLASFPDPIFVLDHQGRIELRNPAARTFARRAGYEDSLPEPLQGIAARALACGENFLPHSFAEGVSFRLGHKDKFYLPRILAMRDKDGDLFGVAVVLYDVTRFRLLDAAKTNLVATVSHELKTPLTGLRMALHLVTDKTVGALLPKQEELMMAAKDDAERLLRILNDLLDLAKLDAGDAGLQRTAVAPADLVKSMVERFADRAAEQQIALTGTAAPDLPPVRVDPQRIAHVFSNLISNAIKHSPAGGKVILGATASDNDNVEFTVQDNGAGIPEEYHTRIFDRFFRVPRQEKSGAGLGLSIAREIAVAHGGRIGVRSAPGKGSTFFVVLPSK